MNLRSWQPHQDSERTTSFNTTAPPSTIAMAPLTSRASSILRACPRQHLPALSASAIAAQRRNKTNIVDQAANQYDRTPAYESPFRDEEHVPSTKIPSFAAYMSKKPEVSNKVFQYFMVGSMGLLTAAGAKATVQGAFGAIGRRRRRKSIWHRVDWMS